MLERPERSLTMVRLTIELAARLPAPTIVKLMRRFNRIQLSHQELRAVIRTVARRAPCRFLVFGVGNDSLLWSRINRLGKTVFLEDDETWLRTIGERHRELDIRLLEYTTRRTDLIGLLDSPENLVLALPQDVVSERWDVVLVDGPAGWHDNTPGRMQSIFQASQVASSLADVFVHDCDRVIERTFSDRYLGASNLASEIGRFRHYKLADRRTRETTGGADPTNSREWQE